MIARPVLIAALAAAFALPLGAGAQSFPERAVTLFVPAPPGGGTDIFARQLAELAKPILGRDVIVENKPGAGGTVGVTQLTAARPDGHTLGFIWNSPLTTSPHTLQVAYTPDSYVPILSIGYSSYVLCVKPEFPAIDAKALVSELKANPGRYTYGNDGVGGTMQLAAERAFSDLAVKLRPVPFNGAGETAKNFLGGFVDVYGGSLPPILPHVAAGKAKCLLLTSAANNPALPQAAGLDAVGAGGAATVLWWGLIAPRNVPADRIAVLERAFREAASSEAFRATMEKQGATWQLKDGKETAAMIRGELEALGRVASKLGIGRASQ